MDQRNETFVPHVLAIVAGTTVDFPNNDQTYHNVFSLSKTKRSISAATPPAARSRSASTGPGIVRVFCDIHSHMSAFILVFAHRYFAVDRRRRAVPDRERAAGHLHRRRLERVGAARVAARSSSRRRRRRRAELRARPPMTILLVAHQPHLPRAARCWRCCRSRVAVYRVNVAVTAQAENELRRGLDEAGTLLEEYRDDALRALLARGAARRRPAEPQGGDATRTIRRRCSRSPSEYQQQHRLRPVRRHRSAGRVLAEAGRLRMPRRAVARRRDRARRARAARPCRCGRTRRRDPGRLGAELSPATGAGRHAERRLQPRRADGARGSRR